MLSLSCSSDDRHVPPLLQGASAGGGNWDLCGLASAPSDAGYSVSPELSHRLSTQFPIGSSARVLQSELERQGFKLAPMPCPGNLAIRRATITIPDDRRQDSFPYAMDAQVYWAADAKDRITWTAGSVSFVGL